MNAAYDLQHTPAVRGRWRRAEPMARHSSWRCGGRAAAYFEPADRDDLVQFMRQTEPAVDILWLGLGSNLLVRDGGVQSTVVATTAGLDRLHWESADVVYAECGVPCAILARDAARHDRAGLEFLAGIPGTVGGALRMNAGALGSETWSFVQAVETIDRTGYVRRRMAEEFTPRYRGIDGPELAFLGAWFALRDSAGGQGSARIRAVLAERSATQPTGKASCGSVFKNPPGEFAGRLIDRCGLKGHRIGGCAVSTVHANFIVNDGAASATDIEALIAHVRAHVAEATGIVLEAEVQIVGDPGPQRMEDGV